MGTRSHKILCRTRRRPAWPASQQLGERSSRTVERTPMSLAPEQTKIGIRRHFTTEGVHPYDQVAWERRDARISNYRDGSVAFEQRDVEFPVTWSFNATNIVAQKYFRGTLGLAE